MPFHEANSSLVLVNKIAQLQPEQAKRNLFASERRKLVLSSYKSRKMTRHSSGKISKFLSNQLSCKMSPTSILLGLTTTATATTIIFTLIQIITISMPANAHSLLQNRHTPLLNNNNNNNNIENGPQTPISNGNVNTNNNQNNLDNSISGNLNTNQRQQQPNAISLNGGYQNRCPAGWMWFNNKCWVATQSRRDFSHAVELCRKLYNNSTLPTIHTEEENEFLRVHLDLKNSPIWLFARHNHQYNKTRWLDRTGVNFTHWDAGQPSDKASLVCIRTEDNWYMKKTEVKDGQTECVSFWEDGKWGTQVGCQVLLPVVCEKKLTAMAKYQIQQQQANGSEPSSEYSAINGVSSSASSSKLLHNLHDQFMINLSYLMATISLIAPIYYNRAIN